MDFNVSKIKKQSTFCLLLMERLDDEIKSSDIQFGGLKGYTQRREDIRKIRRELLDLSKMLSVY